MSAIRLLNICRAIRTGGPTAYVDDFPGSAMSADWSHPTWTIDGEASAGLPVVASGLAANDDVSQLRAARLADQNPSLLASRSVTLHVGLMNPDTAAYLMLDMNDASPSPAVGIRATALKANNGQKQLSLYVDDTLVGVTSLSLDPHREIVRVVVDSVGTVMAYWKSESIPDITYTIPSYTPSGGRVGFGLFTGVNPGMAYADYFRFNYSPESDDLPPRMLVASAGGTLYRENTAGDIVEVTSDLTIADDKPIQSAPYLQKLYIADYGIVASGTGALNGSGVLTDAAKNFTTLGVNDDDHRLEILDGGNGTVGIYAISAVGTTTVTITGNTDNTGGVSYRICRAPKVYNSETDTLTLMPIGTVGTNQPPLNCKIVVAALGRLWWAADSDRPHIVYVSAADDAEDYAYGTQVEDLVAGQAFVYDPGRTNGVASIGDDLTCIIPHSDDYVLFCGYKSVSIQRGDPTYQGTLGSVTPDVGIISNFAYCYTPEGVAIGLSTDGLYLFQPGQNATPQRVSRERLPQELININPEQVDVQLQYDTGRQGINVFVTPRDPGPTTHWWFDWNKKAFFPESYRPTVEPTASCQHVVAGNMTPVVVFGCRDGYLRYSSNNADTDDGGDFESYCLLGPFSLGHPGFEGLIHEIFTELARQSNAVLVEVLVGDSPEQARYAEPSESYTVLAGVNPPCHTRLRGGACFIRISGINGEPWAIESQMLIREVVARLRIS